MDPYEFAEDMQEHRDELDHWQAELLAQLQTHDKNGRLTKKQWDTCLGIECCEAASYRILWGWRRRGGEGK